MRRTLLTAAFLAGCGFQPGTLGVSDDAGGTGDPDADEEIDDPDADGVVGSADNCPLVANADQLDHDADVHGDACDRCPHLPSSTDPDGDGDGVGDDCDPRPTATGDMRVLFEPFYDDTNFATWTEVGAWSVSSGALRQTDPQVRFSYAQPPSTFTVGRAALTVGVRIVQVGTGNQGDDPAVRIFTGTVSTTQGYLCSVQAGQMNVYGYWRDQNNVVVMDGNSAVWPGTFAANSEIRMTDAHDSSGHHCTVSQASLSDTLTATHGPTGGNILLITELAAASFDYVFVVSVGP